MFNKERRRPSQLLLSEKKEDRIWMRKAPFSVPLFKKRNTVPTDLPSFKKRQRPSLRAEHALNTHRDTFHSKKKRHKLFLFPKAKKYLHVSSLKDRPTVLFKKGESQIFPSSSLAKIKKKETPALPFSKGERHLFKTGRPLRGFFKKKHLPSPSWNKGSLPSRLVPWGKKRTTIPSLKKNTPSPPTTDTIPSLYLQKYKHRPFCCFPFSKKEKDMSFPSWKEIPLAKKDAQ